MGMQLDKRQFADAVNGHKQALAAFFGLHFGEIDVQIVDGIILKFFLRRALPTKGHGKGFLFGVEHR